MIRPRTHRFLLTPLPLLMAAVFSVVVIAVGADAQAQGDDPRKVQAAPLFEEGRKLAEKGQNAESLEKFKKAYAIYPSPNTQFNIARQEQLLGRRLDAIRDYREALRNPVLLPSVAELGRTYVAELEQSLGRVKINGPEGARIAVAGKEYVLPLADPIDVEPGTVSVRGTRGEERFATTAEARAGSLITVDLLAGGTKQGEPPTTLPPTTTQEPQTSFWGVRSIAGLVLLGTGAIAIGVGVAANGEQSSQQDKMDSLAPLLPPGDAGSRCFNSTNQVCADYRDARSARDDADARGSTWLPIGIGAAVIGAGLVASAVIWPHHRGSGVSSAKAAIATTTTTTKTTTQRMRFIPIAGREGSGLLFISSF